LNKEMIDKGYAVEYKGQSKDDIKDEHLANKQKLIDSGIYTYQTN